MDVYHVYWYTKIPLLWENGWNLFAVSFVKLSLLGRERVKRDIKSERIIDTPQKQEKLKNTRLKKPKEENLDDAVISIIMKPKTLSPFGKTYQPQYFNFMHVSPIFVFTLFIFPFSHKRNNINIFHLTFSSSWGHWTQIGWSGRWPSSLGFRGRCLTPWGR